MNYGSIEADDRIFADERAGRVAVEINLFLAKVCSKTNAHHWGNVEERWFISGSNVCVQWKYIAEGVEINSDSVSVLHLSDAVLGVSVDAILGLVTICQNVAKAIFEFQHQFVSEFGPCPDRHSIHDGVFWDVLRPTDGTYECPGCRALSMCDLDKSKARSCMSKSRRFKVLKRDGFRCVACGSSAESGADLEVDHILPVSRGGPSTPGNLQTLCYDCNQGKSDQRVPSMEPGGGIHASDLPEHWRYKFDGGRFWLHKVERGQT